MNQPAKIFTGIAVAVVAVMALMKFGGGTQSVKSRRDPKKAAADFETSQKGKVTQDPDAGKPNLIKGVRSALQGSSVDAFDGFTDQQFGKLSVAELSVLQSAIQTQKKYRSESEFRRAEPKAFKDITLSWNKITGKQVKQ